MINHGNRGITITYTMQKISQKYYKEFSHIPPLKKDKKQEEIPLPTLSPIPFGNVEFRDGMGLTLGVMGLLETSSASLTHRGCAMLSHILTTVMCACSYMHTRSGSPHNVVHSSSYK